jgi:mono/diheme cytochrome c family protein
MAARMIDSLSRRFLCEAHCSARLQAGMCLIQRYPPERRRDKSVPNLHRYTSSLVSSLLAFVAVAALLILPAKSLRARTTSAAPQAEKPPAGNTQNGKKLFTSYGCFECHGHQAEGTFVGGPRLGPNPMSFPAFSRYIRQPSGQMPPFTIKVTSDADLADIYAFLQSLPQPPKADSIPALK